METILKLSLGFTAVLCVWKKRVLQGTKLLLSCIPSYAQCDTAQTHLQKAEMI